MTTRPKKGWAARARALKARIRILRRPIYIVWLSLLAVVFFAFTLTINKLYAEQRRQLSARWFQQGQDELAKNDPSAAVSSLRTALLYAHDNQRYVLTLAQALEAAGRIPEARSYFLNLLDDEPGNASVNLELARLAGKQDDTLDAVRYFNAAIYGAWDSDPIVKRQQARQDLINFLISRDMKTQARGELLNYTAEMPKTSNAQLWVAQAFSRLGDDRSAIDYYKASLKDNQRNIAALLGAGRSAFHVGRYRDALEFFKGAVEIHDDPATEQMIQLVTSVIDLNPFESRITASDRRHRLILAMDVADRRLQQCADAQQVNLDIVGANVLQVSRARWMYLDRRIRHAQTNADLVQLLTPVATLVTTVEQQDACGPASSEDQAMLRIYQNAEELQQ